MKRNNQELFDSILRILVDSFGELEFDDHEFEYVLISFGYDDTGIF